MALNILIGAVVGVFGGVLACIAVGLLSAWRPTGAKGKRDARLQGGLGIVAAVFILSGASSVWNVATGFWHHTYNFNLGVLALPIGIGLVRYRRWWRVTALAYTWIYLALLILATALFFGVGDIHPNVQMLVEFTVNGRKVALPSHPGVVLLFYGTVAALVICIIRILTRAKHLFQQRGFSKPWLEWSALAGAGFLAFIVSSWTEGPKVQPTKTLANQPPPTLGSLHLIAAGPHENLVMARAESSTGYPLHQIIARFSGPPLESNQWIQARASVSGPVLAPSPDEQFEGVEPMESRLLWNGYTNPAAVRPSSALFECPNECQLQFALPAEIDPAEAVRQIRIVLGQPVDLYPRTHISLFKIGEYRAWLEVREYQSIPGKLAFVPYSNRSVGQPPIPLSATGSVRSAVLTIPPNSELNLKLGFQNDAAPLLSTTLTSDDQKPGLYWLTWYAKGPADTPGNSGKDWEVFIHDARTARQLHRLISPASPETQWISSHYSESINSSAGAPLSRVLFYSPIGGTRDLIEAEMTLRRRFDAQSSATELSELVPQQAAGSTSASAASRVADRFDAELARLKLQYAEQRAVEAQKKHDVGVIDSLELEKALADRDIAKAELSGDVLEVARIQLKIAEMEFSVAQKKQAVGRADTDEVLKAKLARDRAAVVLRQNEAENRK